MMDGNRLRRAVVLLMAVMVWIGQQQIKAQRSYEPHFSIGVKGGATLSNVAFSPDIEQSMLQGLVMGVSARYTEERFFGLIAELNIEQRGWKEVFDETSFDYSRKLTYIQLPLLTHIYFGSDTFKGFVNLGPSVSYMISETTDANFDYSNPSEVEGFPIENRHVNQMSMPVKNKFDYGILAGAGIELIIKKKHSVLLEGRYYYGLGNIFASSKKDEFAASRGTSIQISIGYMFHIK